MVCGMKCENGCRESCGLIEVYVMFLWYAMHCIHHICIGELYYSFEKMFNPYL